MHKNDFAPTPPMGWNSWDCYAATVTEEQLLGNAEYMAKNLKAYGWEYIVCDIQWSDPRAGSEAGMEYINFSPLYMDAYSRLLPAENRFPSSAGGAGFRPISERIHALGLKFGIHIMRGIPRQAVHARCPVYGGTTADKIAIPNSICMWNGDMYGVDWKKPGAQAYYDSLFVLYAAWGVDYVKVDDICVTGRQGSERYGGEKEIEMIRSAIDRCGRPMVLSLSPGPAPIEKAWHLSTYANMWRMTGDFWDRWETLRDMFERCELWQTHVKPGCWPDCDMLPLGRIGMGWNQGRMTRFTHDEQRTLMTLWSIFRSPLMMGGELRKNDDWTLKLLTNPEVLRLNRHSYGARQLFRDGRSAAWYSEDEDGSHYLALFNLSDETFEVSAGIEALGLPGAFVRDLWARADIGRVYKTISARIPPHGAVLYKLS